ncbi:hypothetical protein LV779_36515 [Streptomyces thinghirensis]|nr:hypothetical protein [Streptomyces thinghirensis]
MSGRTGPGRLPRRPRPGDPAQGRNPLALRHPLRLPLPHPLLARRGHGATEAPPPSAGSPEDAGDDHTALCHFPWRCGPRGPRPARSSSCSRVQRRGRT